MSWREDFELLSLRCPVDIYMALLHSLLEPGAWSSENILKLELQI
jgi:hypothetical protein